MKKSNVFDIHDREVEDGDIFRYADNGIYWVKCWEEFSDQWLFQRQYGATIQESSVEGDLHHCVHNLQWEIKVIGNVKSCQDLREIRN